MPTAQIAAVVPAKVHPPGPQRSKEETRTICAVSEPTPAMRLVGLGAYNGMHASRQSGEHRLLSGGAGAAIAKFDGGRYSSINACTNAMYLHPNAAGPNEIGKFRWVRRTNGAVAISETCQSAHCSATDLACGRCQGTRACCCCVMVLVVWVLSYALVSQQLASVPGPSTADRVLDVPPWQCCGKRIPTPCPWAATEACLSFSSCSECSFQAARAFESRRCLVQCGSGGCVTAIESFASKGQRQTRIVQTTLPFPRHLLSSCTCLLACTHTIPNDVVRCRSMSFDTASFANETMKSACVCIPGLPRNVRCLPIRKLRPGLERNSERHPVGQTRAKR
jgi:hypothetical protein